jgi:aldose 1-epimerase
MGASVINTKMKWVAYMAFIALQVSAVAMHAAVKTQDWGKLPDGKTAHLYTVSTPTVAVTMSDYGARLVSVETLDKTCKKANILLGYTDLASYGPGKDPYFGPIVGRFGNRVKLGQFTLEGKNFQVSTNENGNTLHGGKNGFDRRLWTTKVLPTGLEFTLISVDGDQGFPGTLTAHVTYTLTGDALKINYAVTTDKPTVQNLTNHSYWNLHGAGVGTVLDEQMQIFASKYTPIDTKLIPTGELAPVAGTPFDFTKSKAIGQDIHANDPQLKIAGGGYDHNWVLDGKTGVLHSALAMYDPISGRTMKFETTEPGLQWYSGNGLQKTKKPNGQNYPQYGAVVLETQHFPDSPNEPKWPTTELKKGQTYYSTTVITFGVKK